MNLEELVRRPEVLGGVGALVALLLLVLFLRWRAGRRRGPVVDEKAARARQRLRGDLRAFRDDLKRAAAGADPVFRKIATETEHAEVVGHWRKAMNHRIAVRSPDLGALKGLARGLGLDAMPITDLEVAWRKAGRRIEEYNAGKLDATNTPIATAKELEADLQKVVVLSGMCVTKYGG